MVRDVALAASGLLSPKVGGPSVYPLQPEGVWNVPYSEMKWETSAGEDRYRRSLYTFFRRSSPYPSLVTFDAPSREQCTVRRVRTNTPLQALTTLNDPVFVEAARALAAADGDARAGPRAADRIAYGLPALHGRGGPRRPTSTALVAFYDREQARFAAPASGAGAPGRGRRAAGGRRAAALTMVANVLLNLDATLTRE